MGRATCGWVVRGVELVLAVRYYALHIGLDGQADNTYNERWDNPAVIAAPTLALARTPLMALVGLGKREPPGSSANRAERVAEGSKEGW